MVTIATSAITGSPANCADDNQCRCQLVEALADALADKAWYPDIILLPGGVFVIDDYLGKEPDEVRFERLNSATFSSACKNLAARTKALVVAGVDGPEHENPDDGGDQVCVAWDHVGVVGVGRKVFPTEGEVKNDGSRQPLLVYANDFETAARIVSSPSGQQVILCACYDGFGLRDTPEHDPHSYQTRIHDGQETVRRGEPRFQELLRRSLCEWNKSVAKADIAVVSIHYGSGGRWHEGARRGSKCVHGRALFGSGHFDSLPEPERYLYFGVLDGQDLPLSGHFYLDANRAAQDRANPISSDLALVRLFKLTRPTGHP